MEMGGREAPQDGPRPPAGPRQPRCLPGGVTAVPAAT